MERALTFSVRRGDEVSSAEWDDVSALFSSAYGRYSQFAPRNPGAPIKLGAGYYRRSYATSDYSVAFCRDGGGLVAHAVYFERVTDHGKVAFVVQLVVAADYRRHGIASTLLHSVWGFSDYFAWGIVTSNAFTVRALESATFRKTSPEVMSARSEWWRGEVLSRVPFLSGSDWRVGNGASVVNSGFYTSRTEESDDAVVSRLGKLNEGEEWLAVVFRDQSPDEFSAYRSLIDSSAAVVRDAYRRMPQDEQAWASRTKEEIDVILDALPGLPSDACIESDFVQFGDCRLWKGSRRLSVDCAVSTGKEIFLLARKVRS